MKIAVLCGGDSPERDVSLVSGKSVARALSRRHTVFMIDPARKDFHRKLVKICPDCVFIALHGGKGENGTIQGFLETLNLPYTGSGVCASAVCMNKIIMKKILLFHNIPTPDFVIAEKKEYSRNSFWLSLCCKTCKPWFNTRDINCRKQTSIKNCIAKGIQA